MYSNGLDNLLGYDSIEWPYNDSRTWLDGYESYFASCWEEGLVPHDSSYSSSETVGGSSEKADDAYLDGAETSLNQEVLPLAYKDDQWHVSSSFDFVYGINNIVIIPVAKTRHLHMRITGMKRDFGKVYSVTGLALDV